MSVMDESKRPLDEVTRCQLGVSGVVDVEGERGRQETGWRSTFNWLGSWEAGPLPV